MALTPTVSFSKEERSRSFAPHVDMFNESLAIVLASTTLNRFKAPTISFADGKAGMAEKGELRSPSGCRAHGVKANIFASPGAIGSLPSCADREKRGDLSLHAKCKLFFYTATALSIPLSARGKNTPPWH